MQHIVVDKVEAELIRRAGRSIQVLDAAGKIIGYVTPAPPEEEVERVKAWLVEEQNDPVYSTEQVLEHLRSLEKS
ncbi:MAG TPA: hypothetical protein VNH11_10660 [Pirellulales bacterium]|nr:hypothetical protein [Pirellulales bacterium]